MEATPPDASTTEAPRIRLATAAERPRVRELLRELWGSETIISHGVAHDASSLPALLALAKDQVVGLATLHFDDAGCELVTLNALVPGRGIGSALLSRAAAEAAQRGCRRLWLITTNDNLDALRFYQRRGMRLRRVHPGAVDLARERKPSIPLIGEHGIPLHDELEFELVLGWLSEVTDATGDQSA